MRLDWSASAARKGRFSLLNWLNLLVCHRHTGNDSCTGKRPSSSYANTLQRVMCVMLNCSASSPQPSEAVEP